MLTLLLHKICTCNMSVCQKIAYLACLGENPVMLMFYCWLNYSYVLFSFQYVQEFGMREDK